MSKYTLIVPIAADTDKMGTEMPYLFGLDSNGLMYCVKSIMGLPLEAFSDIYFTILHKHNLRYKLLEMMQIQFERLGIAHKIHVYELWESTSSQPETLYHTVVGNHITGAVLFKDGDSYFTTEVYPENMLYIFPLDGLQVVNPQNKSYVTIDEQYYITNIIEKKIVSRFFCAGGYSIEDVQDFVLEYEKLSTLPQLHLSHIVYSLLLQQAHFRPQIVKNYQDWGTKEDFIRKNK